MSYKSEVLVSGEREWASNGLRFATHDEAMQAGNELAGRWFAVKEWRATEVDEPVTHRFDNEVGKPVKLDA